MYTCTMPHTLLSNMIRSLIDDLSLLKPRVNGNRWKGGRVVHNGEGGTPPVGWGLVNNGLTVD